MLPMGQKYDKIQLIYTVNGATNFENNIIRP